MSANYAKYSGLGGGGSSITTGNLTDVGTDGIVITGGTNAVVGSGTSLAQHVADSTHNGYLSSTDWNTFNSKQATLTIGTLDSQTASTNGAVIATNSLVMQSASATRPGLVNNTTQTFTGVKTFDTVNVASSGVYQYGGSTAISFPATGCTFLGINAGSGSSANYNTALGGDALKSSASGGLNTAIGFSALQNVSTGVNNTAVGVNSGTNITTESGNVCIGFSTNVTGGASNALALGTNALAAVSNSILFGDSSVNVGIANVNSSTPTARLHIPAGTATAGKAPLKLTSGTNLTSPEAGAIEWDGTSLYVTQTSGPTRKTIAYTSDLGSYLPLAGGTMSGVIDMGSHKVTSVTDPTAAQDAATKNYVDTVASGLQPIEAVYAGTIGSNLAGTYNNGASGVGATYTITATGAFTLDGTTPPVNSRILLKDQTSGFQNGVYNLTVAGTTGVSPILTRSSNYNTASEMNAGGLVPIINGTVNTQTSWLQTATITAVGTDNLVFVEWTANPASYLLKANNLSDVASKTTSFNNLSPMTTGGDLIYGGASGAGTRLANGSANQVLQSNGTTLAPTWTTNIAGNAANVTGTVAIGNGGTGQTSKAAGFDALSPMTTSGDVIYGGASGTGTRLAKGSDNQVLTLASGLPVWQNIGTANFVGGSAYFNNVYSWTGLSSTAYSHWTNGAVGTFTQRVNKSLTLTASATSNQPGVTFTPSATGVTYFVSFQAVCFYTSTNNELSLRLYDGTTEITSAKVRQGASTDVFTVTLQGLYTSVSTSAVTIELQGATVASGSANLGDTAGVANAIEITIYELH